MIHIYNMPKQWVAFLLNFVDDEKMFLILLRRLYSPFNSASIRQIHLACSFDRSAFYPQLGVFCEF